MHGSESKSRYNPPIHTDACECGAVSRAGDWDTLCNHGAPRYNPSMTKVEKLERDIKALSAKELSEFRRWYAEFDAAAWDSQFEADVQSGALDRLAEEALADHAAGRSRPR